MGQNSSNNSGARKEFILDDSGSDITILETIKKRREYQYRQHRNDEIITIAERIKYGKKGIVLDGREKYHHIMTNISTKNGKEHVQLRDELTGRWVYNSKNKNDNSVSVENGKNKIYSFNYRYPLENAKAKKTVKNWTTNNVKKTRILNNSLDNIMQEKIFFSAEQKKEDTSINKNDCISFGSNITHVHNENNYIEKNNREEVIQLFQKLKKETGQNGAVEKKFKLTSYLEESVNIEPFTKSNDDSTRKYKKRKGSANKKEKNGKESMEFEEVTKSLDCISKESNTICTKNSTLSYNEQDRQNRLKQSCMIKNNDLPYQNDQSFKNLMNELKNRFIKKKQTENENINGNDKNKIQSKLCDKETNTNSELLYKTNTDRKIIKDTKKNQISNTKLNPIVEEKNSVVNLYKFDKVLTSDLDITPKSNEFLQQYIRNKQFNTLSEENRYITSNIAQCDAKPNLRTLSNPEMEKNASSLQNNIANKKCYTLSKEKRFIRSSSDVNPSLIQRSSTKNLILQGHTLLYNLPEENENDQINETKSTTQEIVKKDSFSEVTNFSFNERKKIIRDFYNDNVSISKLFSITKTKQEKNGFTLKNKGFEAKKPLLEGNNCYCNQEIKLKKDFQKQSIGNIKQYPLKDNQHTKTSKNKNKSDTKPFCNENNGHIFYYQHPSIYNNEESNTTIEESEKYSSRVDIPDTQRRYRSRKQNAKIYYYKHESSDQGTKTSDELISSKTETSTNSLTDSYLDEVMYPEKYGANRPKIRSCIKQEEDFDPKETDHYNLFERKKIVRFDNQGSKISWVQDDNKNWHKLNV